jgi:hypothetical protein
LWLLSGRQSCAEVLFSQGPAADQFPDAVVLPTSLAEREQYDLQYDLNDGDSRQEF